MALSWSTRRQLLYYGVAFFIGGVLLIVGWQTFFTTAPTCNDGLKNGSEQGVDCGGSCALVCQGQARAPVVLWARAFKTDATLYTAAAYIENPNTALGAGARSVRYVFSLYDEKNVLVANRDGVIDIPPTMLVPVVENNIDVGNRTVFRAEFRFVLDTLAWEKFSNPAPTPRISNQALAPDGSRVSATVTNNSLESLSQVRVVAVLFDSEGVARAASKSTIATLPKKSSAPVVFTWPTSIPGVVRAEITVLPPL